MERVVVLSTLPSGKLEQPIETIAQLGIILRSLGLVGPYHLGPESILLIGVCEEREAQMMSNPHRALPWG